MYDVSQQQKQPMAVCSEDARSCYDRIVHVAAFLALRKLGISKSMIVSMLVTIQHMEHHIRTSFGDSVQHYGGDKWSTPPLGTILGNVAAPMIWSSISSILFQCLRQVNCGATFLSPITNERHHTSGFAFVDDTDLIASSPQKLKPNYDIDISMQLSLDTYQGSLRATGGALDGSDRKKF